MRKVLVMTFLAMMGMVVFVPVSAQDEGPFVLTVLHTNDTHAKHEPFIDGNGGVAIQATVVNAIRTENPNTLLLDAGDRFSGSLYHTVHLGQDQVAVMNALGYDAMALGNHEFDNGDAILAEFISGVEFPVLSANIDFSASPILNGLVSPYVVLEVGGESIGIIGLTTAETLEIASPGDELVFDADYAAVANAAAEALAAEGVNKIILLTHNGLSQDELLAPQLVGIDLVIGGHSHSFLSNFYTSIPYSTPTPAAGPYPLAFESAAGEPIYVVTAGENNVFLGNLDLTFDEAGIVTGVSGEPIYLSEYIPADPALVDLVTQLADEVALLRDTPVTTVDGDLVISEVDLVGERTVCRVEECNLGNLVADSLRGITGSQVAIMNGGGIRASIDAGEITWGEVLTTLPFNGQISTFKTDGATLIAALENGISQLVLDDQGRVMREGAAGRFPQVSGLHYSYDPTQDPGSRIVSVEVLGEDGTYAPIDEAATYSVATLAFIRTGGDGYSMFTENVSDVYDTWGSDYQLIADYIALNASVTAEVEGRITLLNAEVVPLGE